MPYFFKQRKENAYIQHINFDLAALKLNSPVSLITIKYSNNTKFMKNAFRQSTFIKKTINHYQFGDLPILLENIRLFKNAEIHVNG